ncbi:MAG TPA: hypothetical protein VMT14_06065 [Burkholderiaceae bacterium]|nr:hypothetical protein [Burkholderiaceae bacterium]
MGAMFRRFAVGAFAGALASFFPRLVAVLGGDPTGNIELFSATYLLVGGIVALAVGVVVVIVDAEPQRKLRDVFMTALGVPTLLMGALTTGATAHNATLADLKIQSIAKELAAKSQIPIRTDMPSIEAPAARGPDAGALSGLLSLVPSAHAQAAAPAAPQANRLGITLREPRYVTVYQEARDEVALRSLQQTLAQRGVATRTVHLVDGRHLLVAAGPARAYSDAVLDGARAKEHGAVPYLVPARQ